MIREWGPPALFLILSCAEYDDPKMRTYLHKVNDVLDCYPIGKLCIEDPISVTQKFEQKFNNFSTVLLQVKVLGKVSHHFIKKEYQAQGTPHYHVLLWIEDALYLTITLIITENNMSYTRRKN